MAINKKQEFKRDEIKLAMLSKALGHPARVAIIKLLSEKGNCIVNQLVEQLPLSQSTISQHLKELRQAGLIKGTVDGPRVCYQIDQDKLQFTKIYFERFFSDNLKAELAQN